MGVGKNSKFHDKVTRAAGSIRNHRPKFFTAHLHHILQVPRESYQQITFRPDLLLLGHKYQWINLPLGDHHEFVGTMHKNHALGHRKAFS
jgi:hypothetical protein